VVFSGKNLSSLTQLGKNGVKAFWDLPEDRKMKEESLMSKEELEQFRIYVMTLGV